MFRHILIPTDGSALALEAAEAGIRLAAQNGARVAAQAVVPVLVYR